MKSSLSFLFLFLLAGQFFPPFFGFKSSSTSWQNILLISKEISTERKRIPNSIHGNERKISRPGNYLTSCLTIIQKSSIGARILTSDRNRRQHPQKWRGPPMGCLWPSKAQSLQLRKTRMARRETGAGLIICPMSVSSHGRLRRVLRPLHSFSSCPSVSLAPPSRGS